MSGSPSGPGPGPGSLRFVEPNKRNTDRISVGKWHQHKDEIVKLYREHPLEVVLDMMQEEHGFNATKRQYVHMLGPHNWNIKKYRINSNNNSKSKSKSKGKSKGKKQRLGGSKKSNPANNVEGKSPSLHGHNSLGNQQSYTANPASPHAASSRGQEERMSGPVARTPFIPRGHQPQSLPMMGPCAFEKFDTNFFSSTSITSQQPTQQQIHWAPDPCDDSTMPSRCLLAADFLCAVSDHSTAFQLYRGIYTHHTRALSHSDPGLIPYLIVSAVFCARTSSEAELARNMIEWSLATLLDKPSSLSPASPLQYTGLNYTLRILYALTWDHGTDPQNTNVQIEDFVMDVLKGDSDTGEDVLVQLPRKTHCGLGGSKLDVGAYKLLHYAFERYNQMLPCDDEEPGAGMSVDVAHVLGQFVVQQGLRGQCPDHGANTVDVERSPNEGGSLSRGIASLGECVTWCANVLERNTQSVDLHCDDHVSHTRPRNTDDDASLSEETIALFCILWRQTFGTGGHGNGVSPAWVDAVSQDMGISASDVLVTVAAMIAGDDDANSESELTLDEDTGGEEEDEDMGNDDAMDGNASADEEDEEEEQVGNFTAQYRQHQHVSPPVPFPGPAHSGVSSGSLFPFHDDHHKKRAKDLASMDGHSLLEQFLFTSLDINRRDTPTPSRESSSLEATSRPGLKAFLADVLMLSMENLP